MANNIADSTKTIVLAGETADVYTLNVYAFKTAKFLVSVVDETSEKVSAFETLVAYKKQPSISALSQNSVAIGDSILYSYNVAFVADETTGKIVLQITNDEAVDLTVYVGEIERVE